MKDNKDSPGRRYGIAAFGPALATALCLLLDPWLEGHLYFLWLLAAVVVTAWHGGTRPALLALILSLFSAAYFFLPPRYSLEVHGGMNQLGLLWFALLGLAVALFTLPVRDGASLRLLRPRLEEVEGRLIGHLEEEHRAQQRLAAQYKVAQILTKSATLEEAASRLLQTVAESLGWDVGLFWVWERERQVLRCIEVWHTDTVDVAAFEQFSREAAFQKGAGLPGKVWAAARAVCVRDMGSDDLARSCLAAEAGLRGAVGFPVRNGAEMLGVMEFFSTDIRELGGEDIQTMTCIGSQISQFIERREAEKLLRHQEHERAIARAIQEGLLPKRMPSLAGLQIGGRSSPAQDVGGDCFDFIPMPVSCDDCLGVVVADASGHGMGAALMTAETRAYVRALALTCADVGAILGLTNRRLADNLAPDHFVTLLLALLDPHTMSLTYASAGHPPGYVLDAAGRTKAVLHSTAVPLGVDPAADYATPPAVRLEADDLVLLYTDGIVEACSPEGGLFGLERLLEVVRLRRQEPPDAILDALFDAVTTFSQRQEQADDMTAVIIKAENVPR